MSKSRRRAFTLTEILVSLSILVVLMGLVLSVLRSSVDRAKSTVCVSNLHQVHLALSLYREDEGEYPPSALEWPGLKRYFGGTLPRCPLLNGRRDIWSIDYEVQASRADMGLSQEDRACMDKRGPDYPIAHDRNHAETTAAYRSGRRFFIFVRQDGAVRTMDAKIEDAFLHDPTSFPCPGASPWSNFR